MSFNKRYVPELKAVKKQHKEMELEDFVRYYTKPDALIGNAESMVFIDKIVKKYYKSLEKKENK